MLKAVVFDLDDTLVPELEYVKSGFRAIAAHFNDESMYEKLYTLFREDKKNVYQRMGFSEEMCQKCIEIYRQHKPTLSLDAETKGIIFELKNMGKKLGIITDGRSEGQRNKICALGLDKIMDCIIVTDELGSKDYRKPHPKSFELMRERLGVTFDEMMYIGDNPQKDFYIGSVYPITTVQILSKGMYDGQEYLMNIFPKYQLTSLADLMKQLF